METTVSTVQKVGLDPMIHLYLVLVNFAKVVKQQQKKLRRLVPIVIQGDMEQQMDYAKLATKGNIKMHEVRMNVMCVLKIRMVLLLDNHRKQIVLHVQQKDLLELLSVILIQQHVYVNVKITTKVKMTTVWYVRKVPIALAVMA